MENRRVTTLDERIHALPQELIDMIQAEFEKAEVEDIPSGQHVQITKSSYRIPAILQINHELRNRYREEYYISNRFHVPDGTNAEWVKSICCRRGFFMGHQLLGKQCQVVGQGRLVAKEGEGDQKQLEWIIWWIRRRGVGISSEWAMMI